MAHDHGGPVTGNRLVLSVVLTLAFTLGEALAGYFSNSLALWSDAGHNLADALALVLSWYAVRMGRKPADERRTYGYHRVAILTALVNAVSLVAIALFIFREAFARFGSPEPVASDPMIWVALVAVLMNAAISYWLHAESKHDLNIRSAYIHMLGDALAAVGVIVAGTIVHFTGNSIADPIVSLLIGLMIIWTSWGILVEAIDVLMEGVPKGINTAEVVTSIKGVKGVGDVHDLHVWSIGSGMIACSCHIRIPSEMTLPEAQNVQAEVTEKLKHDHGISHTTTQVEVTGCGSDNVHCTLQPSHNDVSHTSHNH